MKPSSATLTPTPALLAAALGPTSGLWLQLISALSEDFPGLQPAWKPAKIPFGRYCFLRLKERTLLYLIPRDGDFEISVVLGERSVALALAGDLPAELKTIIAGARRYAEGRSIRFPVTTGDQLVPVRRLVACKIAPP